MQIVHEDVEVTKAPAHALQVGAVSAQQPAHAPAAGRTFSWGWLHTTGGHALMWREHTMLSFSHVMPVPTGAIQQGAHLPLELH